MTILRERQVWRKPKKFPGKRYKLTPEQQERMKLALHVLRLRLGGWAAVADALGYSAEYMNLVTSRRGKVAGAMPVRIGEALGVPIEGLLAGACPMCGKGSLPTLSSR